MKHTVISTCLLFAALTAQAEAADSAAPALQVTSVGEAKPLPIVIDAALRPTPTFELPPILVQGQSNSMFVTANWSWLCADKKGLFAPELYMDETTCQWFSAPHRIDPKTAQTRDPQAVANLKEDWRHNYDGVFAALHLSAPWQGNSLLAVMQGENKNERYGNLLYANSVDPTTTPESCASNYTSDGQYANCMAAYYGFITLRFWHEGSLAIDSAIDTGPLLWPSMGYLANGKQSSNGVLHPSALLSDGYIYIYYLDTSHGTEEGRQGGLQVARMAVPAGSGPVPAATVFFKDGFSVDNSSLPAGFTKEAVRSFYDKQGGRGSALWAGSEHTLYFSVAHIKDSSRYLGVEEYAQDKSWGIRLRISSDLVHWSEPVDIPGLKLAANGESTVMHYPMPVDATGMQNAEIDANDFYLVGAQNNGTVMRRKLSVTVAP